MKDVRQFRQHCNLLVICLYLLPILFFSFYSITQMSDSKSWLILTLGWLIVIAGTLFFLFKLMEWESLIHSSQKLARQPVERAAISQETPVDRTEADEKIGELAEKVRFYEELEEKFHAEIQEIKQKWHKQKQEFETLEKQHSKVQEEYQSLLSTSQEQLKKKDRLLTEYAETIQNLRSTMESKQHEIHRLETSVSDLSYDIDTLLRLNEMSESEPEKKNSPLPQPDLSELPAPAKVQTLAKQSTHIDLSQQLKKCLDMAQKLTGTSPFGTTSHYRDISIENYALDQRRLFDSFRSETSSIIMIYSQREGQLIFANDQVKEAFGWDSEDFIQNFSHLITQGGEEWKQILNTLGHYQEREIHLRFRTKDHQEKDAHFHFALIPTGIFKGHIIGVGSHPSHKSR